MIPYGATGETTSEIVWQNKVHRTQFYITKSCDDSLNQQIPTVFHNGYVEVVANTQTTTIKILNHLYNSYGTVTPREMEDATNSMVTPYYPSNPITKIVCTNLEGSTNLRCRKKSQMHRSFLSHIFWFKNCTMHWRIQGFGLTSSSRKYLA